MAGVSLCTAPAQAWLPSSPYPAWAGLTAGPTRTVVLAYDMASTPEGNGDRLYAAVAALQPGDGLRLGAGVWSVGSRFDVSIAASAAQPIWISGDDPSQRPTITRPDANQNVLNLGSNGPCRYLVLEDLEFVGGGDLLRVYDASYVWLDHCYLHDGGGLGIAAQTHRCSNLFVTHNEIARPGPGTNGEGMYLGAGNSTVAVVDSVVAFNHVHDTRSSRAGQGDGIEFKQGCTRNWILGNRVHDTRNPCVLVYGTGGVDENVIEDNLLFDADDAVLQVQGEALVRNNLVVGGALGFQSHDHQGPTRNLRLIHNTIVSAGRGAHLARWGGRAGMVLANNVIYSQTQESVHFATGVQGVTIAGNVVVGSVYRGGGSGSGWPPGFRGGGGFSDFVDLAPNIVPGSSGATGLDATPTVAGLLDNRGDPGFALQWDRLGRARLLPANPGALANPATLTAAASTVPTSGGLVGLAATMGSGLGGMQFLLMASAGGTQGPIAVDGFHVPLLDDAVFQSSLYSNSALFIGGVGVLDGAGAMTAQAVFPSLPSSLAGLRLEFAVAVWDGAGAVRHVSNPVGVDLVPYQPRMARPR